MFFHTNVELKAGDSAPLFELKNQDGQNFRLLDRKGKWTVLYFYPKADTPGCTKQACTFSQDIQKIRNLKAEVYGVSVNSPAEQKNFQKKFHLQFMLLADDKCKVTKSYGVKMPLLNIAKRWTFLIDPDLKIAAVFKDVSPAKDAGQVAEKLKGLLQK